MCQRQERRKKRPWKVFGAATVAGITTLKSLKLAIQTGLPLSFYPFAGMSSAERNKIKIISVYTRTFATFPLYFKLAILNMCTYVS